MEQGQGVGKVWKQQNVVFLQKLICGDSPVGRGIVMVQDPIVGAPFLRAMSAHSVAGLFCRIPYLPSVL